MARRLGYAVQKSRHHTGLYRLIDPARNRVIFGRGYTATLDDVREYLTEDMRTRLVVNVPAWPNGVSSRPPGKRARRRVFHIRSG